MPTVHENDIDIYSEDSFSDKSEDELKSSRATPQSGRPRSANRARPGSAQRAPPNKPPSPYLNRSAGGKSRNRPSSAGGGRKTNKSSKELWLESLRLGGGRSSGYVGPVKTDAWSTCSDYLKETVLGMPPKRHSRGSTMDGPMMARPMKGVPNYKPQEEMYDDILELKKSVNVFKKENERLSARNRRLETEHAKKERMIEQLLDPSQASLRATLSSKQPDTAAKVSSLKNKSLKLEMQLKDREADLTKLQNDLKTTKMEEMRVAMESFYQEVLRLRHHIKNGTKAGKAGQDASNPARLKALNGTILRLTENNQRLQSENKLLKQDLDRALDGPGDRGGGEKKRGKGKKKEYEDMNRKELLSSIADLEEKLDKLEGGNLSNRRHGNVPGKTSLSGTLPDRLDQLDKRETELLEEKINLEKDARRLKEDKSKMRQRVEDQEFEILALQKQVADLEDQLTAANNNRRQNSGGGGGSRETTPRGSTTRGSTPRSGSLKRYSSQESVSKTMTPRNGSLKRHPSQESLQSQRSHRSQATSHRSSRPMSSKAGSSASLRRRKQEDEEEEWIQERDRRVEEFKQNRSAKSIQKNWRAHQQRAKDVEMDSSDMEDAAVTIQSAMRGHKQRKEGLNRLDSDAYSTKSSARSTKSSARGSRRSENDDDSDIDDAAMMIQSAVRGHWSRKDQLQRNDTESERGSERGNSRSRSRSGSRGSRPGSVKQNGLSVHSDNDSDDDSIVMGSQAGRSSVRSAASHNSRPMSAKKGRESLSNGHSNSRRDSNASKRSIPASHRSSVSRRRGNSSPDEVEEADDIPVAMDSDDDVRSHHSKVSRHSSVANSRRSVASKQGRADDDDDDDDDVGSHHSKASSRHSAASKHSRHSVANKHGSDDDDVRSHHSKASARSRHSVAASKHAANNDDSDDDVKSHHSHASSRHSVANSRHSAAGKQQTAASSRRGSNASKAGSQRNSIGRHSSSIADEIDDEDDIPEAEDDSDDDALAF